MTTDLVTQNTSRNNLERLTVSNDTLRAWSEAYFQHEVTTVAASQKGQRRDLRYFIQFMLDSEGRDARVLWTPRLSKAFVTMAQKTMSEKTGRRRWGDKAITRMIAHLKTFSSWIHTLSPFPLGNPMEKIKAPTKNNFLDIERALTEQERRRVLDAADLVLEIGGRSRDRHRHKGTKVGAKPKRKGYRPHHNRAIMYTFIETGMRLSAITHIDFDGINPQKKTIRTIEKGSKQVTYTISSQGMQAIQDYLDSGERDEDAKKWQSPALYLSAATNPHGDGRLSSRAVTNIWDAIAREMAGVKRSPHSARHGMGKHMERKAGIPGVQRQLQHENIIFSVQYAQTTRDELQKALDDR